VLYVTVAVANPITYTLQHNLLEATNG